MSEQLIQRWLDNECGDSEHEQLEQLLREDSAMLQRLQEAVAFQEELRSQFSTFQMTEVFHVRQSNRRSFSVRLVASVAAAAAILLAVVIFFPQKQDTTRPTDDPLVRILAGNPKVELIRTPPGPNPGPVPRDQWPSATRITLSDESSSIRWGDDCILEGQAGDTWTLRMPQRHAPPLRTIELESGQLTVRLETSPEPLQVLVGDSQVRAAEPVVFSLKQTTEPQPFGQAAQLSVQQGKVTLQVGGEEEQIVVAGQSASVP